MYYYFFLVFIFSLCLPKTAYNGFGLGEGSDFSTNVDEESLNRQFLAGAVIGSYDIYFVRG